MKITQASIQTLAILGAAATATNAASLRGAEEQTTRKGVSEHAARKGAYPAYPQANHNEVGGKVPRTSDHMAAYQAREGQTARKEVRKPDHLVAYQARQGETQSKNISTEDSHPREGAKRTREPDYMVAYAASEADGRASKRARFGGDYESEEYGGGYMDESAPNDSEGYGVEYEANNGTWDISEFATGFSGASGAGAPPALPSTGVTA